MGINITKNIYEKKNETHHCQTVKEKLIQSL